MAKNAVFADFDKNLKNADFDKNSKKMYVKDSPSLF
jgi:hypothetical protein